jgi:hypothetical protein
MVAAFATREVIMLSRVARLALLIGLLTLVPSALFGQCTTIKDGVVTYSAGHYLAGQPLQTGYDAYGYNYQAHMFSGYYANAYLGKDGLPPYEGDTTAYLAANPSAAGKWYWPYREDQLSMKWDEEWLSNKDCDSDGKLDRYYGYASYIGSGAWLTNHQSGNYTLDGKKIHWTYFVKIVAAPADATKTSDVWYEADGTQIGPALWGEFAIIQEVYNDPGTGDHGISFKTAAASGFGYYEP